MGLMGLMNKDVCRISGDDDEVDRRYPMRFRVQGRDQISRGARQLNES